MRLLLKRRFKGEDYTIGDLFIDGEFFCNILEDRVRELPAICPKTPNWEKCECKEKVYGKTAIPAGVYKITIEYSSRFKRKLPLLHDVPHFIGILIHSGNRHEDSDGCLLTGFNRVKGQVLDSLVTSNKPNEILSNATTDITIEIV